MYTKIEGQGRDKNWPKSDQTTYKSGSLNLQKWNKSQKLLRSYRVNKSLHPAAEAHATAYEPIQNIKSPRYTGVT